MCQSAAEGGRRCAAHTRPAYQRAFARFEAEPDATRRAALVETHKPALIDHAMTPSGAREFAAAIDTIETTYTAKPARTASEETSRQEYLAALRLTQTQAEIRAEVEETVRRAQRYATTGSHREPGVPDCTPVTAPQAPTLQTTPTETINIAGTLTPVTFDMGGRRVTRDEWDLAHSTSGATLRAACAGEGLPVSGTNAARARRLTTAGLTKQTVEERYGWRARRTRGD